VEIQTEITRKDINFINDIDLRFMLLERLKELDKVFLVNGNFSTIFLAISTIEGIFKHIATIFKTEILKSSNYPLNSKGKRRSFNELSINDLYLLLKELDILPNIPGFEHVYRLFKDYRNFIHPQAQKSKAWPMDIGQAQMALGLLNASVSHLAQYIFIDKEIFRKLAGNPDYDYSNKVLHLKLHRTPLHSFLVLNRQIANTLSLNFDLELPQGSIFNFVFNFVDEANFKMLRLDNRGNPRFPNCVLHCTQKYFWKGILSADYPHPPQEQLLSIAINTDFPNKIFSFAVNEDSYSFKDKRDNYKNLFDELEPNLKIGFFNEEGPVKLSNIRL